MKRRSLELEDPHFFLEWNSVVEENFELSLLLFLLSGFSLPGCVCVCVCVCRPGGRSNLFTKLHRWCTIVNESSLRQGFSGAGVFLPVNWVVTTLQWGVGLRVLALLSQRVALRRDPRAYSLSLELPRFGSFWAVNVSFRRDHLAYVIYLPNPSQVVVVKTSSGMMGMWWWDGE